MLAKHPDPTVDHVLKTWAPRMIVQGIDYNDLMTTGARIGTWDDWCREWCATAAGHEAVRAKSRSRRQSGERHRSLFNGVHGVSLRLQQLPAESRRVYSSGEEARRMLRQGGAVL